MTWQLSGICQNSFQYLFPKNENIFQKYSKMPFVEIWMLFSECHLQLYCFGMLKVCLRITHMMLSLFSPRQCSVRYSLNTLFFSSDFCFFICSPPPWILFRKLTISQKTHTSNTYSITAQHFSVIQVLLLNVSKIRNSPSKINLIHKITAHRHKVLKKTNNMVQNWKLKASCSDQNVALPGNTSRNTLMQSTNYSCRQWSILFEVLVAITLTDGRVPFSMAAEVH
jgi:hypothetical protein